MQLFSEDLKGLLEEVWKSRNTAENSDKVVEKFLAGFIAFV